MCISDDDECATYTDSCDCASGAPCTYACTDTEGSFDCSCGAGFELGIDGFTCEGNTSEAPTNVVRAYSEICGSIFIPGITHLLGDNRSQCAY